MVKLRLSYSACTASSVCFVCCIPAQTQNLSLKKKRFLSNPTKKKYTETILHTKLALSAVTRLFTSPTGTWTWRIGTGSIHPTVPLNPSQTCCKKARFKQPFFVKSKREAGQNQRVSCPAGNSRQPACIMLETRPKTTTQVGH
uniref:Putative secreted protein n=1 Tax=Ixodes ricinus TaxID=34613 RepID=A0A6B0UTV1_IXORI